LVVFIDPIRMILIPFRLIFSALTTFKNKSQTTKGWLSRWLIDLSHHHHHHPSPSPPITTTATNTTTTTNNNPPPNPLTYAHDAAAGPAAAAVAM
jgi:hypothetical protein